jgi:hypothetical protein
MNYVKHYQSLISKAMARKLPSDVYVERHHIVPKCLGGGNELSNLVQLTAREHFVAHQLLIKIHPGVEKLIYAACMMAFSPTNSRVTNKIYGWLKTKLAELQSSKFTGKVWTEAQNKSRSETVKAQWADPDFKARRSEAMRGRNWSKESRAAKSAEMLGKPGRVWTAEQKAKLSETKRSRTIQTNLLKGAVNHVR